MSAFDLAVSFSASISLTSLASSADIAPSATTTMLNRLPARARSRMASATRSAVVRDFGDEDHVGAAGDPGAQSQPAGTVAHHLDDNNSLVARGRGMQPVDGLRGNAQCRVETNGYVGLGDVVIDGLGQGDDVSPASFNRRAFFCVPPPPMQTMASRWWRLHVSRIAPVMSRTSSPICIWCGLSRLVPKIVPPLVRMPESILFSNGIVRSWTSPRNPSQKPTSSIPKMSRAALPTPRIAAFSPGQSPPLVRIPICFMVVRSLATRNFQKLPEDQRQQNNQIDAEPVESNFDGGCSLDGGIASGGSFVFSY